MTDFNDENDQNDDISVQEYARRSNQRPLSLISRGSKAIRQETQDPETGEWRTTIRMSRLRFDDTAKEIFLREYEKWGRIGEAASAAGVSTQTVRKHMEEDEDFGEMVILAEDSYREKLISHHQNLLFYGTEKKSYDRNGNLVSTEIIYPIRLIELELKKHDSGYRDKQEIQMNHTGGVLVAPAEMNSIDDWESKFSQAKDVTPGDREDTTRSVRLSPPVDPSDDEDEDDPF